MLIPYSYLEVQAIDEQYDEQVPLKSIAENVNRDFHDGKTVRTANSMKYVISRLYNGDGDEWLMRLEEKWIGEGDS